MQASSAGFKPFCKLQLSHDVRARPRAQAIACRAVLLLTFHRTAVLLRQTSGCFCDFPCTISFWYRCELLQDGTQISCRSGGRVLYPSETATASTAVEICGLKVSTAFSFCSWRATLEASLSRPRNGKLPTTAIFASSSSFSFLLASSAACYTAALKGRGKHHSLRTFFAASAASAADFFACWSSWSWPGQSAFWRSGAGGGASPSAPSDCPPCAARGS